MAIYLCLLIVIGSKTLLRPILNHTHVIGYEVAGVDPTGSQVIASRQEYPKPVLNIQHYTGENMVVAHQSLTTITVKGLKSPLPLFCISPTHETTKYTWEKLGQPSVSFPSEPVIYVNEVGLYRCQLTDNFDETTVESNIISVEVKPGKAFFVS